jgi:hypothetical protein
MPRYRFDFLQSEDVRMAVHEIDYEDDLAAIRGGHIINGAPPIGAGFQIWQEERLVYWHRNEPTILN